MNETELPPVPASGIVYLFADQFVRAFEPNPAEEEQRIYEVGEEVPCSEKQVEARALAEELMVAALLELDRAGYLRLILLVPPGVAANTADAADLSTGVIQQRPAHGVKGLEEAILNAITKLETQNSVHEITWRVIGQEDAFPGDFIIKLVQQGLHHTGVYDAHLRPGGWLKRLAAGATVYAVNCKRVAELRGRIDGVKQILSAFRNDDPALEVTIRAQVASGIRSRFVAAIDGKPQPDEM